MGNIIREKKKLESLTQGLKIQDLPRGVKQSHVHHGRVNPASGSINQAKKPFIMGLS